MGEILGEIVEIILEEVKLGVFEVIVFNCVLGPIIINGNVDVGVGELVGETVSLGVLNGVLVEVSVNVYVDEKLCVFDSVVVGVFVGVVENEGEGVTDLEKHVLKNGSHSEHVLSVLWLHQSGKGQEKIFPVIFTKLYGSSFK